MRRDPHPSIIIAITAGAGTAEPGEGQEAPDRANSQRLPASEKAGLGGCGSAPQCYPQDGKPEPRESRGPCFGTP